MGGCAWTDRSLDRREGSCRNESSIPMSPASKSGAGASSGESPPSAGAFLDPGPSALIASVFTVHPRILVRTCPSRVRPRKSISTLDAPPAEIPRDFSFHRA